MVEFTSFEIDDKQVINSGLLIELPAFTIAIASVLVLIPSVELITPSVFLFGYLFRMRTSIKLTLLTVVGWEVVASLTYGFALMLFPFKVLGWLVVMIIGNYSAKLDFESKFEFAIVGGFTALLWDLMVLPSLALFLIGTGGFIPQIISSFIFGIPFTVIHVLSTSLIFSLLPKFICAIKPTIETNYPMELLR